MTFYLLFEPRDFWIGAFIDTAKKRVYILPLPCLGIVIEWGNKIAKVVPPIVPSKPVTYIISPFYQWASDHAHALGLAPNEWRVISQVHHLQGLRNVHVIKVPNWEIRSSGEFIAAVHQWENTRAIR